MKIFSMLILFLSSFAHAETSALYEITRGKFHKGGEAEVAVVENQSDKFIVKMSYQLYKKIYVPIPRDALAGEMTIEFPKEFKSEQGYKDLEALGEIALEEVKIKFLERVHFNGLTNAYKILIEPNNHRSKIVVIYHPDIFLLGWGEIEVTLISSIGALDGYQIQMLLQPGQ